MSQGNWSILVIYFSNAKKNIAFVNLCAVNNGLHPEIKFFLRIAVKSQGKHGCVVDNKSRAWYCYSFKVYSECRLE